MRRLAPFTGAALAGFVSVVLPPRPDPVELAAAGALLVAVLAAVVVFEEARPGARFGALPPIGYVAVVALMRDAQGGGASGYAPLMMLPVFWLALYGTRRQLGLCIAAVTAAYVVPVLALDPARYPNAEWRRALLWAAVTTLVGFTTHELVSRRGREAEERARERDFVDAVIANAGAVILVLDAGGRILRFNPAAERLSGCAAADVLGKTLWEIGVLPPEDVEDVRAALGRVAAGGISQHENRWVARDGSERRLSWSNTALAQRGETHVIATGVDVTDLRRAEARLRDQAERLASVLSAATEYSIIGTDLEGTITVFNVGAERMLGYAAAEMIGTTTPARIHDRGEVAARAAELGIEPGFDVFVHVPRVQGSETRDWTYVRKDGARLPVSLTVTATRDSDGVPTGYIGIARDISAERAAQRALSESEERHRLLVQNLPDATVSLYDTDLRVLMIEGAMARRQGFTADVVVGQRLSDLVSERNLRILQPVFEDALAGAASSLEYESDRNGILYHLEVAPYRDDAGRIIGVFSVGRDVTARRHAETQTAAQASVSRIIAERLPLREMLPHLLEALCADLGWAIGLSWAPSADRAELRLQAQHAAPTTGPRLERLVSMRAVTPGAAVRAAWSERRTIVLDVAGDPADADVVAHTTLALPILTDDGERLGVAEFLGERREVREGEISTLESIAAQFARHVERERAEARAAEAREEFIATVSHELRTPVTAIKGWIEILLEEDPGPLNDEQRHFLAIVRRNSERLMRLVDDLLVARQLDSGQLELQFAETDLAAVARETVDLLASLAETKRIGVRLLVDEGADTSVHADRNRLAQLLSNLISNAIKFTPEEGSVTVAIANAGDQAVLTVADTGIGIPEDDRPRLFSRFYRGAASGGVSGTGLGLAISKAIAEAHGGSIELVETDGPGATFRVALPLRARESVQP